MLEIYRKDPAHPVAVINDILEDGEDQGEMLIILRRMAKAFGSVASLAADTGLNTTQLYRTLSPKGNPELRSLVAILKALGLRLEVKPIRAAKAVRSARSAKSDAKPRAKRAA